MLVKKRLNFSSDKNIPSQITLLLKEIGYVEEKYDNLTNRKSRFWVRNIGRLEYILHDIKELWLAQIKQLHPDRNPEHALACQRLNQIYQKIKKMFDEKINPRLRIPKSNRKI